MWHLSLTSFPLQGFWVQYDSSGYFNWLIIFQNMAKGSFAYYVTMQKLEAVKNYALNSHRGWDLRKAAR